MYYVRGRQLDFFLWDYLKENMYVSKPAKIQRLKDDIIRHFKDIEPQLCLSVIEHLDQWRCVVETAADIWPTFCFTHNFHKPY